MRAIFFDEADAEAVVARLLRDGFVADLDRERLAGEDDDEDHPWAVTTDAPVWMLELVADQYDGWLDIGDTRTDATASGPPPPDLPVAPRRIKRPDLLDGGTEGAGR